MPRITIDAEPAPDKPNGIDFSIEIDSIEPDGDPPHEIVKAVLVLVLRDLAPHVLSKQARG